MFCFVCRTRCHTFRNLIHASNVRHSSMYYAVRVGRKPGIYLTWYTPTTITVFMLFLTRLYWRDECKIQVEKFPRSVYKKFVNEHDALAFVNDGQATFTELNEIENKSLPRVPEVFTDGACIKSGAQGGIGVFWGPDHPWNVSERLEGRQTNNRAEIHAVIRAVQQAKEQGIRELTIATDSLYVINSMTKWLPAWQENDWKTSQGKPIINKEDIELLLEHCRDITIHWNHVRGHQGVAGNEEADRLATEGANKPDNEADRHLESDIDEKG